MDIGQYTNSMSSIKALYEIKVKSINKIQAKKIRWRNGRGALYLNTAFEMSITNYDNTHFTFAIRKEVLGKFIDLLHYSI